MIEIINISKPIKPILKWAGGKRQLLDKLLTKIPDNFNNYIEPFIGGGALFFAIQPKSGVISDLNPELINLYKCVANNVKLVIKHLESFNNTESHFYKIRSLDFNMLEPEYAAARMIYLNKTCFNGLYRVNKKGFFNVPFGKSTNRNICQTEKLLIASKALQKVDIICGDYKDVLTKTAKKNDLIFLDPPYIPISKHSNFNRYTKEQFKEQNHIELAQEISRLQKIGCYIILTSSNNPLTHKLYKPHQIEVINTRRNISSLTSNRTSEDIIVTLNPTNRIYVKKLDSSKVNSLKYPNTRYMGSKEKVLPFIKDIALQFEFDSVLDLFSGTGVVGYMFKTIGKQVFSNDYMAMCATFSKAMIENNSQILIEQEINSLFISNPKASNFVQKNFSGLYYTDHENIMIDLVRHNIHNLKNKYKRAIAMSALIRACMKKRPRGHFSYIGSRYQDQRDDLQNNMEKHIRDAAKLINKSIFDNNKLNKSRFGDAITTRFKADMVYLDPPYYTQYSDNDYTRRYHFVEGLARNWQELNIQSHTKTKKFKSYLNHFSSAANSIYIFDKLFNRFKDSILLFSYSSNSPISKEHILSLMSKYKKHTKVIDIDYKYSFNNSNSNKNNVQEYIFIGR